MSIDFEPTPVQPKRRRVDPIAVAIVAVLIAVGAAVVKPWDAHDQVDPSRPPVAAAPTSAPTAAPPPIPTSTPRAERPPPAQPPTWADVASVIDPRDGWGVLTVARRQIPPWSSDRPVYLGDWVPSTAADGDAQVAAVEPAEGPIVLMGVTVPAEVLPLAVRIWRVHANDQLEWMDANPIERGNWIGSVLFMRPGIGGVAYEPWEAGRYLIDVLIDHAIQHIAVQVPDRAGNLPPPDIWITHADEMVSATMSEPPVMFLGMFAYTDGKATPLQATPAPLLDETDAWLDLVAAKTGVVASAYLPRASTLGIMLPTGARAEDMEMRRLTPDNRFDPPQAGRGNSDRRGRSPFVVFEAPDHGVWTPGIYAISLTWLYQGSTRHDTWHVELRPGRV